MLKTKSRRVSRCHDGGPSTVVHCGRTTCSLRIGTSGVFRQPHCYAKMPLFLNKSAPEKYPKGRSSFKNRRKSRKMILKNCPFHRYFLFQTRNGQNGQVKWTRFFACYSYFFCIFAPSFVVRVVTWHDGRRLFHALFVYIQT